MSQDLIVRNVKQFLLFDAIEYGIENNVFTDEFVDDLQEEGAAMTVKLAEILYNPNYEVYLKETANIVLGICNLGAHLWGERDPQKVSFILQENGLVKIFRKGYTEVKELAALQFSVRQRDPAEGLIEPKIESIEKEIAIQLIVSEGVDWEGETFFIKEKARLEKQKLEIDFLEWCAGKNWKEKYPFDVKEYAITTRILSTLIYEKSSVNVLSGYDAETLFNILTDNSKKDFALEKIASFSKFVPDQFITMAENYSDIVWGILSKLYGNKNEIFEWFFQSLLFEDIADAAEHLKDQLEDQDLVRKILEVVQNNYDIPGLDQLDDLFDNSKSILDDINFSK